MVDEETIEEILAIPASEGRRGLEKAQAMLKRNAERKANKTAPGRLKKETKIVE